MIFREKLQQSIREDKKFSRRAVQYIVEKYVKMAGINQKRISAHTAIFVISLAK
ncbi:hypothetical protein [Caldicellulosiruptor morganii]|uniref:Uncharacterized protein n=1 Tax=Caldicellulosiruptor morganii TaxID=1387555 RepID=A0ABY7BTZ7_9FIRM|nr:hypothetical protein [Caldicellulosiruptor morganii]WAM34921.1 hypothetical protein OTK00_001184 [Caldicellulosiruptor morganii]